MTLSASRSFSVPKSKMPALRALIAPPMVAWPSVAALGIVVLGVGASALLALAGVLPYWAACALSGIFLTWEFTAIHEALHRSLSRNVVLNDWLGRLGILILLPHSPLEVFRWYHARHHRFTNGKDDPDNWMHGSWWQLPVRWMSIDFAYLYSFIVRDHNDPIARKLIPKAVMHVSATIIGVVWLTSVGYGREVLLLWFLPTRLAFLYMGFAFFWLPHSGEMEQYTQQQDPTLASSMRLGHENFLNPALQFHNYHLIHHLYPSTPSYRHPKVWRLLEQEIRACGVAVNQGFDFKVSFLPPETLADA